MQVGMVKEVLTEYGPVNRFWFDGTKSVPKGTDLDELWKQVQTAMLLLFTTITTIIIITIIITIIGTIPSSLYRHHTIITIITPSLYHHHRCTPRAA